MIRSRSCYVYYNSWEKLSIRDKEAARISTYAPVLQQWSNSKIVEVIHRGPSCQINDIRNARPHHVSNHAVIMMNRYIIPRITIAWYYAVSKLNACPCPYCAIYRGEDFHAAEFSEQKTGDPFCNGRRPMTYHYPQENECYIENRAPDGTA